MPKKNVARDSIWPEDPNILVRAVVLYVGQGSSSVIFVKNGDSYHVLLVDTNKDAGCGGIDIPRMMKDLLDGVDLYAFVNTHPHDDHICDVKELSEAVAAKNIWHSGHKPSKKYGSKYPDLQAWIDKVKEAEGDGAELVLEGSRSAVALGDAKYHVLAPATHVTDDVNEDEADARRRRIHEQCAVIKFGDGTNWIMHPGDADRAAFEEHITSYHKDRLGAFVLVASHHGSRTFFRENEDNDPYTDALDKIDPTYVVISAPKQCDSKHDHPHDDAVELYEEKVGAENVLHTGKDRYSFIFDIYKDGTTGEAKDDAGKLAEEYGHKDGDGGGGNRPAKGGYTARTEESYVGGQPRRFA